MGVAVFVAIAALHAVASAEDGLQDDDGNEAARKLSAKFRIPNLLSKPVSD
jgi:hypothetical protein